MSIDMWNKTIRKNPNWMRGFWFKSTFGIISAIPHILIKKLELERDLIFLWCQIDEDSCTSNNKVSMHFIALIWGLRYFIPSEEIESYLSHHCHEEMWGGEGRGGGGSILLKVSQWPVKELALLVDDRCDFVSAAK